MAHTILRLPAVQKLTGLSRSTIYLRIQKGSFPRQINLGERAVGWRAELIERWIQSRIEASRVDNITADTME